MDISVTTVDYAAEDLSWLGSAHGQDQLETITLDVSAFTSGTHYPNGYFPSGLALAKITSTGLYGPYAANVSEVQTLTFDATSGVYTLAFDGSAASASQTYLNTSGDTAVILAALESLSTINPGDVTVTRGTPAGNVTIFTVTFGGQYVGQNVPLIAVTETLVGGSTTLVPATTTAGGSASSNGQEIFGGHLARSIDAPAATTTDIGAALMTHGVVIESKLPANHGVDAAAKVSNGAKNIRYR